MSVVVGKPNDTVLPEACCDAILLRQVYHRFTHPKEMRASLQQSLRPEGLLWERHYGVVLRRISRCP